MPPTAATGKVKRYMPGELLIQENEISRRLFLIKRGQVSVFKSHMGQKVELSTMGEGEIFGELSFIEASPRSASVEAVTIVEVQIIEVNDVTTQLDKLPDWVLTIFKTVFARLRAANQKTVALHGFNGFERKHFGKDSPTQKTYRELLRTSRLLKLAFADAVQSNKPLRAEDVPALFSEVLGDVSLSVPLLLKVLKDQGFIVRDELEKNKRIVLQANLFDAWIRDLQQETGSERFLRLSDPALGVLKSLHEFVQGNPRINGDSEATVEVSLAELGWSFVSFGEEAISELKKFNIVKTMDLGRMTFSPAAINRIYGNQVILRFFAPEQRSKAS